MTSFIEKEQDDPQVLTSPFGRWDVQVPTNPVMTCDRYGHLLTSEKASFSEPEEIEFETSEEVELATA